MLFDDSWNIICLRFVLFTGLTDVHQGTFESRRLLENSFSIKNYELSSSKNLPANANPKSCKRKGGWKFHDLSDEGDGIGKKKRAYGQNKLENDILQVFFLLMLMT